MHFGFCYLCCNYYFGNTFSFYLLQECLKKIQDCDRSIVSVEKKFLEECKKFGVKGDDIRKELLERVRELPHDLDVIGSKCKDLLPVVEYYAAFVDFSLSRYIYFSSSFGVQFFFNSLNVKQVIVVIFIFWMTTQFLNKVDHFTAVAIDHQVAKFKYLTIYCGQFS